MEEGAIPITPPRSSSTKEELIKVLTLTNPGDGGIFAHLAANPFFTAGFGLASLGAAAAVVRRGLQQGASLLKRRLLVDLEISRNDESYQWFLHWMSRYQREQLSHTTNSISHQRGNTSANQQHSRKSILASLIQRLTPGLHHLSIQTSKISHPNGSLHTRFSLIPGPGRHILRYKNTFLAVNRSRETKALDLQTGSPWETVTLTTLYSQRHVFEELLTEAHKLAMRLQEGKTLVFTAWGTEWRPFGQPRRKRPLDSVILDKGVKESIVDDVKDFLNSGKWYFDRGIPYRRGYLLHGPPGTGKSSFIQALAGELDYNISILNLSERGLTDDRLNHLLTNIPTRTIVLLEDVDAAFSNRRTQTDTHGYRGANVTFSGLLNALDGVTSAEERLIFLTTNHVDRLDEALVRPGRVDMAVRLGEATRWQVGQLWDRFYGELDPDGVGKLRFLSRLEELDIVENEHGMRDGKGPRTSPAALQGLFLFNKGNIERVIEMAHGLVVSQERPDEDVLAEKAQSQVAGSSVA
ncbi:MAG: hypothetical protein M1816_004083 [Peltula sp. TS41687]|nr:MAG: hypothetical protein M1816_004083 [Peltula sp. TS41687]